METKQRKTYLDIFRILACLFVLYNHSAGQVMRLTEGVSGAAALWLLYYSKPSMPMFLMITGTVMLGRTTSYQKSLMRVLRILAVLVLFSLFYYATDCLIDGSVFRIGEFFDRLYHTNITNSFWYLYAYLGVLIMMPILQRMSMGFGPKEYWYAIVMIMLFAGLMPMLQHIWPVFTYDSAFELPLFGGILGSILMGYHMDRHIKPNRAFTVIALVVPAVIAVAETLLTMRNPALFNLFDNSFLFPALFGAMCLFYLIKLLDARLALPPKVCAGITAFGKLTFCMYLVSDFFVMRLKFIWAALEPTLHTNGAGIVYTLAVILCSTLTAAILTRIPGLKKII